MTNAALTGYRTNYICCKQNPLFEHNLSLSYVWKKSDCFVIILENFCVVVSNHKVAWCSQFIEHILLVLGWWNLVLFELTICKLRNGGHLEFLFFFSAFHKPRSLLDTSSYGSQARGNNGQLVCQVYLKTWHIFFLHGLVDSKLDDSYNTLNNKLNFCTISEFFFTN